MNIFCSWCGKQIDGEPVDSFTSGAFTWGDGEVEIEIVPGYEAVFCCAGCSWAFSLDKHKILGMSGKDAREHLIKVHEIKPGRPGGKQSRDCFVQSKEIAEAILKVVYSHPQSEFNVN